MDSEQSSEWRKDYLMHRKYLAICGALVALGALAIVPTVASATTLKDTVGTETKALAVGAKITAIGTSTSEFVASGTTIKCNENWLTGEVKTNDGTTIEGTITGAKFQSNLKAETKCDGGLLFGATTVRVPALTNEGGAGHWCIKTLKGTDNWEITGANCGTSPGTLTFVLEGNGMVCRYTRSLTVGGHFTTPTDHSASTVTVTNEPTFTLEPESSFPCPESGKITNMSFHLYTHTETLAKSEEDPVFITNP